MATGTQTYDGLAVPLHGESNIKQQTAATDILTITGAASQSGDFLVCENSTGGEQFIVSSSGAITTVTGLTVGTTIAVSGSFTGTQATLVVSASTMTAGVFVSITSTGALTGGAGPYGVLVQGSSKSVLDAAFAYKGVATAGDVVGTCNYFLATDGSKSPTYFLGLGGSAGSPGTGAPEAHAYWDDSFKLNTFTCDHPFVGLKCMAGSLVFHLIGVRDTGIT